MPEASQWTDSEPGGEGRLGLLIQIMSAAHLPRRISRIEQRPEKTDAPSHRRRGERRMADHRRRGPGPAGNPLAGLDLARAICADCHDVGQDVTSSPHFTARPSWT
jgi:hypothetical protein